MIAMGMSSQKNNSSHVPDGIGGGGGGAGGIGGCFEIKNCPKLFKNIRWVLTNITWKFEYKR